MTSDELMDLYKSDFLLVKEHNFRIEELDSMLPFQRRIYAALVMEYLNKKAQGK